MINTLAPIRNQLNYNYVNSRNNSPIGAIQQLERPIINLVEAKQPNQLSVVQDKQITRPGDLPLTGDLGENLTWMHMRLIARPLAIALQAPPLRV